MWDEHLERELDAALAKYAAIEPREGLEQRVLANLRAHETKDGQCWKSWQAWSAAGLAFAAMAVFLIWMIGGADFSRKSGIPKQQVKHEVANTGTINSGLKVHENSGSRIEIGTLIGHSEKAVTASGFRPRPSERAEVRESLPKLAQFPAPEPLSEQEKLLVRYVEDDPERAELIAEATALAERSTAANDAEGASLFQSPEEER